MVVNYIVGKARKQCLKTLSKTKFINSKLNTLYKKCPLINIPNENRLRVK